VGAVVGDWLESGLFIEWVFEKVVGFCDIHAEEEEEENGCHAECKQSTQSSHTTWQIPNPLLTHAT
jgi:hypothetical protein